MPPIFEIHQKIHKGLLYAVHNWNDDHSIGKLILDHVSFKIIKEMFYVTLNAVFSQKSQILNSGTGIYESVSPICEFFWKN